MIQDITATCIDIAGATPNLAQDGTSLLDILAGGNANRTLLYEHYGAYTPGNSPPIPPPAQGCNAVVSGNRWKFTRYDLTGTGLGPTDNYELVDLTADPTEQINLAQNGAYLSIRNTLEAATDAILAS